MQKQHQPKTRDQKGSPENSRDSLKPEKQGWLQRFLAWVAKGSEHNTCPT